MSDDFVSKLAHDMARSGVEAKESYLLEQFKNRPSLLSRLEDIVLEESPMTMDTLLDDDFALENNSYKFVITYKYRLRLITDEERVHRYVESRIKERNAVHGPARPEVEAVQRAHYQEKAWGFIRDGVKL